MIGFSGPRVHVRVLRKLIDEPTEVRSLANPFGLIDPGLDVSVRLTIFLENAAAFYGPLLRLSQIEKQTERCRRIKGQTLFSFLLRCNLQYEDEQVFR